MPVAVNDVFQCSLHQKLFGQDVVNTFAFRVGTVGTIIDDVSYMDAIFADVSGIINTEGQLKEQFVNLQCPQVGYSHWLVQKVQPTPSAQYLYPILTGLAGGNTGDCESANIAMCLNRKGENPGRRNRGRVSIAGIPTTGYAAGLFTAPTLALGESLASLLRGVKDWGAAIGSVNMGFYSPAHDGLAHGDVISYPANFVFCRTSQARQTVRVQRSRTIGVGR